MAPPHGTITFRASDITPPPRPAPPSPGTPITFSAADITSGAPAPPAAPPAKAPTPAYGSEQDPSLMHHQIESLGLPEAAHAAQSVLPEFVAIGTDPGQALANGISNAYRTVKGLVNLLGIHEAQRVAHDVSEGQFWRAFSNLIVSPEALALAATGPGKGAAQAARELKTPGERARGAIDLEGLGVQLATTLYSPSAEARATAEAAQAARDVGEASDAESAGNALDASVNIARGKGFTRTVDAPPETYHYSPLKSKNMRSTRFYERDAGQYGVRYTDNPAEAAQGATAQLAASKPYLLDMDEPLPLKARTAFEATLHAINPDAELSAGATARKAHSAILDALRETGASKDKAATVAAQLAQSLNESGYDGILTHTGSANEIELFNQEAAKDYFRDAPADHTATVPVTAKVALPTTVRAKLVDMFGKSVFGSAIHQVRSAQNVIAQGILEAAMRAHLAQGIDGIAETDFLRSPLGLSRKVAANVRNGAAQIYGRLRGVAGDTVQVSLPADIVTPGKDLTVDQTLARLDEYLTNGTSSGDWTSMTLDRAMQNRSVLSDLASKSNDAQLGMVARSRVQAYDQAIQNALSAFDHTAAGREALKAVGINSSAQAYQEAKALWSDGSALGRVADKLAHAQGLPTEAFEQAAHPEAIAWDWKKVQQIANDPANARDLLRVFGTPERVEQFRTMVNLAVKDGGDSFNRLAAGMGSLFLGNLPVYRMIWSLGSLSPHAAAAATSLTLGYRLLSGLTTTRVGPELISEALTAMHAGRSVQKYASILTAAALMHRTAMNPDGTIPHSGAVVSPGPSSPLNLGSGASLPPSGAAGSAGQSTSGAPGAPASALGTGAGSGTSSLAPGPAPATGTSAGPASSPEALGLDGRGTIPVAAATVPSAPASSSKSPGTAPHPALASRARSLPLSFASARTAGRATKRGARAG